MVAITPYGTDEMFSEARQLRKLISHAQYNCHVYGHVRNPPARFGSNANQLEMKNVHPERIYGKRYEINNAMIIISILHDDDDEHIPNNV